MTVSNRTLWVVCPVYNDVESFLSLRRDVLVALDGLATTVRFALVDDSAGRDSEVARVRALGDVTIVTPPFNLGHQRAIVFGLRTLASEIGPDDAVVTMDSDGEDQARDVPRLLEPLLASDAHAHTIVLALRTKRRESVVFQIFYGLFKLLFRSLTGLLIRTGNFAAYKGSVTREILFHPHFDACYSSSLLSLNLPVAYVPCERGRRYAGQSRMGYLRLLMHGIRMLMPFLDRIAVRSLVGFTVMFFLGIALAFGVLGVRLFTQMAIPGWATSALLLVLILSFLALGNFVILFTLFSQSQSTALAYLDRNKYARAGSSPSETS